MKYILILKLKNNIKFDAVYIYWSWPTNLFVCSPFPPDNNRYVDYQDEDIYSNLEEIAMWVLSTILLLHCQQSKGVWEGRGGESRGHTPIFRLYMKTSLKSSFAMSKNTTEAYSGYMKWQSIHSIILQYFPASGSLKMLAPTPLAKSHDPFPKFALLCQPWTCFLFCCINRWLSVLLENLHWHIFHINPNCWPNFGLESSFCKDNTGLLNLFCQSWQKLTRFTEYLVVQQLNWFSALWLCMFS